jgi:hypothetical protein
MQANSLPFSLHLLLAIITCLRTMPRGRGARSFSDIASDAEREPLNFSDDG